MGRGPQIGALFGAWLVGGGLVLMEGGCSGRDVLVLDGAGDAALETQGGEDAGDGEATGEDGAAEDTGDGGAEESGGHDDGAGLPDGSWRRQIKLSASGTSAYAADVRLTPSGDAHLIWTQDSTLVGAWHDDDEDIWTSHAVNEAPVCPQPLELEVGDDDVAALVYADGAYVSMMRLRTFAPDEEGDGAWGSTRDLEIDATYAWTATAAMREGGVLDLIWQDSADWGHVMAAEVDPFAEGGVDPVPLRAFGPELWGDGLGVISGPDGTLATWVEQGGGEPRRVACRATPVALTDCASPTVVASGTEVVFGPATGATLANGDVFVVYPAMEGPGMRYRARRLQRSTGEWDPPEDVTPTSTGYAEKPRLLADGHGGVSLVWLQCAGSCAIWSRRLEPDALEWGPTVRVADDPILPYERAYAGADGAGNLLVIWSAYDGFRMRVYERRLDVATGTWSEPAVIDEHSTYDAELDAVAVNETGQAVVVWGEYDASYNRVLFARRLE